MTTPLSSERDTRIDVLRALALLMIFVDHVPGTVFELFTYKNFGFSDAAAKAYTKMTATSLDEGFFTPDSAIRGTTTLEEFVTSSVAP